MHHHRHTHLIMAIVAALLLLAARPVQAQQLFSVTTDTIPIALDDLGPYSNFHVASAIKYHNYYYLNVKAVDATNHYKNMILAVSTDGKQQKIVDFPNTGMGWYAKRLYVRNDTLFLSCDIFEESSFGHYFDDSLWQWYSSDALTDVVYEDDLYSASFRLIPGCRWSQLWFTEKQSTFHMETKNGWLQPEYTHRKYMVYNKPFRIVRNEDTYYFVYQRGVSKVDVHQRPGIELRKSIYHDNIWENTLGQYGYGSYFPYNEDDDVIHLFGNYQQPWWTKTDTFFQQAFCYNGQMYYVVTTPKGTSIAQIVEGQLKEVIPLLSNEIHISSNQNIIDENCLICFCPSHEALGVIDIDCGHVRILYFSMQPKTLPYKVRFQ